MTRTKAITITDSDIQPVLKVEDGELSAARCRFGLAVVDLIPGLLGNRARLDLAQCNVVGSDGFGHIGPNSAIEVSQTSLVIRGDKNSRYLGGTYNGQQLVPSITGNNNSTLIVDPAVVLSPAPKKMLSIKKKRLPALYVRGGELGGSLDLELYSPATHRYVLAVALPTAPFDLPFGRQWLDIPSEVLLVFGAQGAAGFTRHRYAVPNTATFRGLALGFQAVSGTATVVELTNPVVPVLH